VEPGKGTLHVYPSLRVPTEASIQKAQNKLSTQLIKASSCVKKSHAKIGDEDLSYFSSYQTLLMDKNW
jgi:hypothetical protein